MQNPSSIAIKCLKRATNIAAKISNHLLVCGIFLSGSIKTFAQNTEPDCEDCKKLNEVSVYSFSPEKFMSGYKIQKIDSINLARFQYQTLADFLQFQAPLALKSYGSGQLTTIAFRGTSANHTAVLWNGLNINSPTVGLSDLSTIPMMGFDQMAIQYGSSASCVGTDAVGGSILLNSAPKWQNRGINSVIGTQFGSFRSGNLNAGIRMNKPFKRFEYSNKTLIYGGISRNFNGENPNTDAIRTDRKGREYSVEPSKTIQKGFVHDSYIRFITNKKSDYKLIYFNSWITDNKLTIQPTVLTYREITQTQAYRFILGSQLNNTSIKLGFIRDILDYGKGDFTSPSHASTDRYIFRVEHDFFNHNQSNFSVRIGSEIVHFATQVDGYGPQIIQENRGDGYALIRKAFKVQKQPNKLIATLNLRQALSSVYKAPFTPALGINYSAITSENQQINLLGNIAQSYRLPTLNERYWQVLGNPNIQPEKGFNKEIGIEHKLMFNQYLNLYTTINAFHNLIDNWTYWNPAKNYRVENLQQVLSKGLEFSSSLKFNNYLAFQTSGITLAYSLTHASQQKVYDIYAQDLVGKQLIYVPRHSITMNTYYGSKKWNVSLQGLFNSARYFTFDHSGEPFPPYFILNSTFSHQIKVGPQKGNFILQANNLTNTVYPNVKRNAMPGINFQAALVFSISQ